MEKLEEEYLLELWERNICPFCGNLIPEGTRIGRGQKPLCSPQFSDVTRIPDLSSLKSIETAPDHIAFLFRSP
jgi:hypothetical protein